MSRALRLRSTPLVIAGLCALSAAIAAACYGPDGSPQYTVPVDPNAQVVIEVPPRSQFDPVAVMLNRTCGTLDCHGQVGRNLRLYGHEGLRLDPSDIPGGSPLTEAEGDADFRSAVGLEPERWNEMTTELENNGDFHPEWLTIYRKALGLEAHTGLAPIAEFKSDGMTPDDRWTCLTTWMQSAAGKVSVDTTACANAIDPKQYP